MAGLGRNRQLPRFGRISEKSGAAGAGAGFEERPFTAICSRHLWLHGLTFGIASVTSTVRSIPPSISPSRTQPSACHQSS